MSSKYTLRLTIIILETNPQQVIRYFCKDRDAVMAQLRKHGYIYADPMSNTFITRLHAINAPTLYRECQVVITPIE